MPRFRVTSFYAPAFVLLALLFIMELRGIVVAHQGAQRARARLEQRLRELKRLGGDSSIAIEEQAAAIEQDLRRAGEVLRSLERGLVVSPAIATRWENLRMPTDRLEAFLDLSALVEEARENAVRLGVALKPDERFGFSSYATEGPDTASIPAIFRQRLAAELVIDVLLEARPHHLVSFQREAPPAVTGVPGNGPGRATARTTDFFVMEPRLSSRVPGLVETMAFRLVFVGSTGVLRSFLNRLSRFELPAVVRCVEAEPATGLDGAMIDTADSRAPAILLPEESAADATDAPVPVASPVLSKFTVTVEFIELAAPAGPFHAEPSVRPAA